MESVRNRSIQLSMIKKGKLVRVLQLEKGESFRNKMIGLGIITGVIVEVVSKYDRGPVVLKINNSRVMLGYGMSEKITVAEVYIFFAYNIRLI